MKTSATRTRAYLAMSLDGFIAGPHHELDWLTSPRSLSMPMATGKWAAVPTDAVSFEDFISGVGAMLMGRHTFDAISGMDGPWPYGDIPIIVATTRPLSDPPCAVVSHSGEIASLVRRAQQMAGAKDVYVDGGDMVRQALAANLVDELIITVVPTALGQGISLFAGLDAEHPMTVHRVAKYADGLVQLHLIPRPSAP